jgi:hypothetical protein
LGFEDAAVAPRRFSLWAETLAAQSASLTSALRSSVHIMDDFDPVELERIRRWGRPDWRRFVRPDWERYVHPAGHEGMRKDFALWDRAFETPFARRLRLEREERDREEREWETACAERKRRADIAWERFKAAFMRGDFAPGRKANFNPDQPRDELGRWTDGATEAFDESDADATDGADHGSSADGGLPPHDDNHPPERVPRERPEESRDRTKVIRAVSNSLRLILPAAARLSVIGTIISGAVWLREYRDEILTDLDPPKTLRELNDAVEIPRSGTQRHHVVEQGPAEQDGFSRSEIDAPDNLVRIPKQKHQRISDWYSTKSVAYGGMTPRDWLRGKSWEERRSLGIQKLIDFGVLKP